MEIISLRNILIEGIFVFSFHREKVFMMFLVHTWIHVLIKEAEPLGLRYRWLHISYLFSVVCCLLWLFLFKMMQYSYSVQEAILISLQYFQDPIMRAGVTIEKKVASFIMWKQHRHIRDNLRPPAYEYLGKNSHPVEFLDPASIMGCATSWMFYCYRML